MINKAGSRKNTPKGKDILTAVQSPNYTSKNIFILNIHQRPSIRVTLVTYYYDIPVYST